MKDTEAAMTRRAALATAWAVCLSAAAGCSDSTGPVRGPVDGTPGLIVSGPVGDRATAGGPLAITSGAASASGSVYVSLVAGAVPSGVLATIRDPRNGQSVTAPVVDGGFDPVPIPASVGDTLLVEITRSGSAGPLRLRTVVRAKHPPVVVRTNPPSGGRDVPLNASIVVVFSQPISRPSVTLQSLQVLRDAVPIAAHLAWSDTVGLAVAFVPDAPLTVATRYRLVVSGTITDRDGDALQAGEVVDFTTVAAPPAGGLIAYQAHLGIYVMASDGRFPTRIVTRDVVPYDETGEGLSWSPDGSEIVFAWPQTSHERGLDIVAADGTGLKRITAPPDAADDGHPAWSPAGNGIAFVRMTDHGYGSSPSYDILVVNPDGTGLRVLAHDARDPAWSPDGHRVAFAGIASDGMDAIYTTNADGTGSPSLIVSHASEPAWSPDGRRIAFSSGAGISVANADGSNVTPVTTDGGGGWSPSWSPEGTRIVFARSDGTYLDLFAIDADGSNLVRLTNTPASEEAGPEWAPAGARRPTTLTVEPAPGSYVARQIDTVFATLSRPYEVRVLRNGIPAAGVTVRWTYTLDLGDEVTEPVPGRLSDWSGVTDANGVARVVATLGGPTPYMAFTAQAYVDGAAGSPVVYQSLALPGRPARIYPYHSSGARWAFVLSTDTTLHLGVYSTDAYGNEVLGVRTDFAVTSGGGTVAPAVDSTRVQYPDWCAECELWGAFTSLRRGSDPGPQTVTATASELPGAPTVTFTTVPVNTIVESSGGYPDPASWQFAPANTSVAAGSMVGWRLTDGWVDHNVTFEDDPLPPVSSGTGGIHTRTFTAPGVYRFRCTLHSTSFTQGEVGTVTVH